MSLQARSLPVTPPASALDLAQIFEPVRDALARVEREFAKHLESRIDVIPEMGRYIQMSGGKRVRPAVLLMAARICGYTGDRAVLNAAVVEFIHTATLVHDDIIDGAETWRAPRGAFTVGQRRHRSRRLPLHRSMAMALTRTRSKSCAASDVTLRMIEGGVSAHDHQGDVDHRGSALRDHPPEDGLSFGLRRSAVCSDRAPRSSARALRALQPRRRVSNRGRWITRPRNQPSAFDWR